MNDGWYGCTVLDPRIYRLQFACCATRIFFTPMHLEMLEQFLTIFALLPLFRFIRAAIRTQPSLKYGIILHVMFLLVSNTHFKGSLSSLSLPRLVVGWLLLCVSFELSFKSSEAVLNLDDF